MAGGRRAPIRTRAAGLGATLAAAAVALVCAGPAQAAKGPEIADRDWAFEGVFGTHPGDAARRGLQVYRQVCAVCHSLDLVAFRTLTDIGFSADEVKAIAEEYQVEDGPNDEGEMYTRPGRPSDYFPAPFPNDEAARFANNGALPPDLSVITKARPGGPDYLYALLTGYTEPPEGVEVLDGMFYNAAFPGHQIAMPPPLFEGGIEYEDATPATVEQMAADVTTFLAWAAEPELDERKRLGVKVILFLLLFTALLYVIKRQVWSDLE